MATRNEKKYKKTVAFFRLKTAPDGAVTRQREWSELLSGISEAALANAAERSLVDGDVVEYQNVNRLVLSKDRGNAPRQRNLGTREKRAMRTRGAEWNPIEEGFVTFLDIGNVFAYARSSAISPSPRAVADWLNASSLTSDVTWVVEPLIDPSRYERLQADGGVTMVDITARPALAPDDPASTLLRSLLGFRELGDVKIEIKASVTRGKQNRNQQEALRQQALDLLGAVDEEYIEGAKVKKIGEQDPIDLIEHHITSKSEITIPLGDLDRSMNDDIVFRATDGIILDNAQSIRRIIGQ